MVQQTLKNKIIVGHSLHHDFKALSYHPGDENIRDLTHFNKFMQPNGPKKSLKSLTYEFLGR